MAPPAKPPLWREGPLWPIWKCICLFWPEGPLLAIWIWMPIFARGAALAGDISGRCGHGHMDVHFSQWGFSGRFETWMSILARGASPADLDVDVHFGQRGFSSRFRHGCLFWPEGCSGCGHGCPFRSGPLQPIWTWTSIFAEGASLADLHMDVRFGERGLASPADLDMDVHFGQRASPADLDMDVHFGQREFSSRCAER